MKYSGSISDRIAALRSEMKLRKINLYIVSSTDYHNSEYIGDYFKERQYVTGFTGSAGTAVFAENKAGLWTDGRYFIQAEKELQGSGIELFKMGEPDCPSLEDFVRNELPEGGTVGFDGRTVQVEKGKEFAKIAEEKRGKISCLSDLVDFVWEDRPKLPSGKAYALEEAYAGESVLSKLERVRKKMSEAGADVHLLSSLDDIAWLLNIRGNDIPCCPLVLAHLMMDEEHVELFTEEAKFSEELRQKLAKNNVFLRPYTELEDAIRQLKNVKKNLSQNTRKLLIDPERISYAVYKLIPDTVKVIEEENPEIKMKSVKNDIEVEHIRQAHLKDAVAHTKFMYWLKKNIGKIEITEISASDRLEAFRKEQDGYLGPSFEPISAYHEHGAIVHYSASEESYVLLKEGHFLLTDTGGHYKDGSTDITRTVALGDVSRQEKEDFTLVLRAMLRLMNAVFLEGCSGANLDCIAREVFWKERLNFNHGTGHGVGYLLNIHEPPINFRWREGKNPAPALEKNMVITDEPGIYREGLHGIRIENELLVAEDEQNEFGKFLHFEPLTFVPVDLDAVLPEKMNEEEKKMLNEYHYTVYEKLEKYLDEKERIWLKKYTRPI